MMASGDFEVQKRRLVSFFSSLLFFRLAKQRNKMCHVLFNFPAITSSWNNTMVGRCAKKRRTVQTRLRHEWKRADLTRRTGVDAR